MILDGFLKLFRNVVYGDSVTMPTHIAVGTGTTAVTASDTSLQTEIFPDGANRSQITSRTKPTDNTLRLLMLVTVGQANGESLTELGAANAATGGTFHNRIVHPAIAKDASYELKYQIEDAFSNVA